MRIAIYGNDNKMSSQVASKLSELINKSNVLNLMS